MSEKQKKISLKKLLLIILAELFIVAAVVWFFDPFYQYHAPFAGLRAVLNDRDNQVVGTVRNFEYDSVLLGSSVSENFDSEFLDAAYHCNTLKVVRASGSVADLLYYLEMAQEKRDNEFKNVFWCLDLFALNASTEITLKGDDIPEYLHTESVLDDIPYLFNKEILLEKIPYMLACSLRGQNTDGDAYNWARDKEFGAEMALKAYYRSEDAEAYVEQKAGDVNGERVAENIRLITEQIEAHPETKYYFILPPYSMLWWDCAYLNGELEERFYTLEQVLPSLLTLENAEVYFFQAEEEIVCNLDNYMDMLHYSPEINQLMLEKMVAGENRITEENREATMTAIRKLVQKITSEKIFNYYPVRQ